MFSSKVYKSKVGDFPLIVHPCKYWWVGLGVACTYETNKHDEKWERKHCELKKKFGFTGHGLRPAEIGTGEKKIIVREIFIVLNDRTREAVKDSELLKFLTNYESGRPRWSSCPYENCDQSKCPFYEQNPAYSTFSLEELRERKGYEL